MPKQFTFKTRKPCAGGLVHTWTFFPQIQSIQLSSFFADDPNPSPENFTEKPIWLPRDEFDGVLFCTRENPSFEEIPPAAPAVSKIEN